MNRENIEKLEKIMGQLEGLHRELSNLAKKSPNDGVNAFKLKFLNSTLKAANDFLGEAYKPLEGFSEFDIDDVTSNSDAAFVLTAYLEEIERKRADNIVKKHPNWEYRLLDNGPSIKTAPPKKIKEKK